MCKDLGTSGYVFLVSRKLCIWITSFLQRLFRAFLYHTLPYRYLQSKSHFRLLSPFFNTALRQFWKFHVICQKLTRKKKRIEWKWKGKLTKLFSKNVSLLFCSTFHSFSENEIIITTEMLITFDMQRDTASDSYFSVPILHSPVCCHHKYWQGVCWKPQLTNYSSITIIPYNYIPALVWAFFFQWKNKHRVIQAAIFLLCSS